MIIAISNQKGGVAKTTTTVNLGAALAERGYTVLMLDLDPQANLTIAMGLPPHDARYTIANVLMSRFPLANATLPTASPDLDLLPSNRQVRMLERFLPTQPNYEYALHRALEGAPNYHFCLCDCPPELGPITLAAVTAADLTLVPVQPEPFAVYGTRDVLQFMDEHGDRLNQPMDYRLLVTMFDVRNRIHNTTLDGIRKEFSGAVLKTVIEVDTQLRESQAAGQPITEFATHTRGAEQYRQLAKELLRAYPNA